MIILIVIDFLVSLLVLTIIYHLALTYINIELSRKNNMFPSFLLSIVAFVSKEFFHIAPIMHTIIIVLTCTLLLFLFSKVNILISLIGSLLSFITLMVGSLLLICPFLIKIGLQITKETKNLQWILLNLAEVSIPLLVLVILKIKKISLLRNFE